MRRVFYWQTGCSATHQKDPPEQRIRIVKYEEEEGRKREEEEREFMTEDCRRTLTSSRSDRLHPELKRSTLARAFVRSSAIHLRSLCNFKWINSISESYIQRRVINDLRQLVSCAFLLSTGSFPQPRFRVSGLYSADRTPSQSCPRLKEIVHRDSQHRR